MTGSSTEVLNWQRLNPWTPVVLGGRALVIVALLGSEEASRGSASREVTIYIGIAILAASVVIGVVRWLVTKWALDGVTLRIETGLFRRDARQLPVARIQAVDVVRPFLARVFGLAELRIRLAGGGKSGGKLTYLSEAEAVDLRARLMAGHHGLDMATPEPAERPLATVPTGRLVASAILQPATLVAIVFVVVLLALESISPKSANGAETGTGLTLGLYLFGLARVTWRRVATEYGFAVAAAPDGIRLKRGLFSTVNETIPFARVQAVRKAEPLTWRFWGWCRLEVDVAGSPGREQGTRSGKVTKALLPVGPIGLADELFSNLLGLQQFPLSKPPRRARWKSPLSYHFLAAGDNGLVAAGSCGRLKKVTTWVPLEKVQSVRRVQGPVQRLLHLATVHVDAAGRDVRAEFRDRDVHEADALFEQLVVQSRSARRAVSGRAHAVHGPLADVAPLDTPASPQPPHNGDGAVADSGAGDGTAVLSGIGQPLPPPPMS
ncbi:MAG TPA: PH domain-containing protein [Acidimicrobiales bacterium]|nr:PH domain-containing protein [Acidimicrobiales bacterium]